MRLPGHTTHQARHTLATRLVKAGASMAHVKTVLGHVSERMGDSYVLIAGSQVEPYGYWKRQEERWARWPKALLTRLRVTTFTEPSRKSSQALAGLEKALLALDLLDQANELDLRSPHQDFFDPIWRQGWRAGDLVHIGSAREASVDRESPADGLDGDEACIES